MLMRLRFVLAARRWACDANRSCCAAFFLPTATVDEWDAAQKKRIRQTCIFQPTPKVSHYDDREDKCSE